MGKTKRQIAKSLAELEKQFDRQFEEIAERDQLWERYRTKAEQLLDNAPDYQTPQIINDLVKKFPSYVKNIKNEYVAAGNKIDNIVGEKLDNITSKAFEGLNQQYNIATEGGAEYRKTAEEGVDKIQSDLETNLSDITGTAEAGGTRLRDIYKSASSSIVNTLKEGVSQFGEASGKSLDEQLSGIGNYEKVYENLATRTEMPGEGIMLGQLQSQNEAAIQRVKEYGSGSAEGLSAIANVYEGGQEQIRNLAIDRANYLTDNQKSYAQSQLTGGMAKGQAYDQYGRNMLTGSEVMAGGYQTAAQLEGEGEMGALGVELGAKQFSTEMGYNAGMEGLGTNLDAQKYATGLELDASRYSTEKGYNVGMEGLNTELDMSKQASLLRAMGYEKEAEMMEGNALLGAQYQDQAWNYNKLMPYQNKVNYYTQGAAQYDPFQTEMDVMGNKQSVTLAQYEGLLNKQVANRQMWGQIISSVIGAGGSMAGAAMGKPKV